MIIVDPKETINILTTELFGVKQQAYDADGNVITDSNGNPVLTTSTPYEVTETDTSGVVRFGKKLLEMEALGDSSYLDNAVRSLVSRVSRMVFVDRLFGETPLKMLRTDEIWGEIVEKVRYAIDDVKMDDSWNLQEGKQYPQDTYYPPHVSVMFFDGLTPFVYPVSKTVDQMYSAFASFAEFSSFLSGLEVSIQNAMTIYFSTLEIATLNTYIAKILSDTTAPQRTVKLLTEYYTETGIVLTKQTALANKEFLQWMCARIDQDVKDMQVAGTFYNGTDRYPTITPKDKQVFVTITPVVTRLNSIAKANTFNAEFINLPRFTQLPSWQGRKENGEVTIDAKTSINIKNTDIGSTSTEVSGIVGVLYDYDAMGINMYQRRVDITPFNARARFWTEYHRGQGRYFIDPTENGVVYLLDDVVVPEEPSDVVPEEQSYNIVSGVRYDS